MIVLILTIIGLGLIMFNLLYRQVYYKAVNSPKQLAIHCLVFVLVSAFMFYIGYLTASSLVHHIGFAGHWLSMLIFFFLGMKMYKDSHNYKTSKSTFNTDSFKVLALFVFAHSFDFFIAGISLGFYYHYPNWIFLAFVLSMLFFIIMSYVMARRQTATLSVWLFSVAGSVIVGMNVFVILALWLVR